MCASTIQEMLFTLTTLPMRSSKRAHKLLLKTLIDGKHRL